MLGDQLVTDYIAAYKAHDATKLSVLRLLKTAISNRLVELKQPGGSLSDEEILDLILKQAKQRKDSIEQYEKAGRKDLAAREAAELKVLEGYMPRQISDAEMEEAIAAAIAETGANSPGEMGKVMGIIMARYKGRVDGKKVSEMTREMLTSTS